MLFLFAEVFYDGVFFNGIKKEKVRNISLTIVIVAA